MIDRPEIQTDLVTIRDPGPASLPISLRWVGDCGRFSPEVLVISEPRTGGGVRWGRFESTMFHARTQNWEIIPTSFVPTSGAGLALENVHGSINPFVFPTRFVGWPVPRHEVVGSRERSWRGHGGGDYIHCDSD